MKGPWLLGIDLQNVFADSNSYWATERFAEVLPRILELIDHHAPQVVLTRFVAPERPIGAWIDYYRDWPGALTPADDPQYDLVPEVASRQKAYALPVITRPTFGKWDGQLASMIVGQGLVTPELMICGVSTDCCVISTALAAADAGVAVHVVADACAGANDEDHARALAAMSLYAPLITIS